MLGLPPTIDIRLPSGEIERDRRELVAEDAVMRNPAGLHSGRDAIHGYYKAFFDNGAARFARTALNKVFPDHWSFMIGELGLYCFIVLVLTGVYLTFFFDPSSNLVVYDGSYEPLRGVQMTEAYHSALELSFDVRAGLVMRQIHHWAALLFLASIAVHLGRVFFTGAFRRPRELNWIIGCTLLILALVNGLFGYSLLDDQLSGTGLRIVYSVALSIPLVGTWIVSLLFGGEFGDGAERCDRGPLARAVAVLDDGRRGRCVLAVVDQKGGGVGEPADAHQEHQGSLDRGD